MTLEELTAAFTQATQAEGAATGYATAFHAGTAAVVQNITRHLLGIRATDPLRLKEAIIALSVEARPAQPQRKP